MTANTRIEANAINHLATLQPVQLGIGIELVEKCHSHRQIGVGKQLDCLCFCAVSKEHRHILLDGSLQQQIGKHLCPLRTLPHYDA
ncbi:hypothetical protein D3C80_2045680 [compost metagenome]